MLDVSDNELKSIPPEIVQMLALKTLILSRCSLQRTIGLSNLPALTKLELDGNDLEGDRLRSLPISLTKLSLSHNHFQEIPQVLHTLINIVELDLSFNRLTTTAGLGFLVKVVVLILDNNELLELTEDVSNCRVLKLLSLKHNHFQVKSLTNSTNSTKNSIPASLFINTVVERIDLEGNKALCTEDVMHFEGVDVFLERRKVAKDKVLLTGALSSTSLFGLE